MWPASSRCLLCPAAFEVGKDGLILDMFASMVPDSCVVHGGRLCLFPCERCVKRKGNLCSGYSPLLGKLGVARRLLSTESSKARPSFLPWLCRGKVTGVLDYPSQGLAMSMVQKIELCQDLF